MSKTIHHNDLLIISTEDAKNFAKHAKSYPANFGVTYYENRLASEFEYDLKLVSGERSDYYHATNKVDNFDHCIMLFTIHYEKRDDVKRYFYVDDSATRRTDV